MVYSFDKCKYLIVYEENVVEIPPDDSNEADDDIHQFRPSDIRYKVDGVIVQYYVLMKFKVMCRTYEHQWSSKKFVHYDDALAFIKEQSKSTAIVEYSNI